jgi:hypothetical protein
MTPTTNPQVGHHSRYQPDLAVLLFVTSIIEIDVGLDNNFLNEHNLFLSIYTSLKCSN